MRRNDIHKVLIIGSGPIIIGQACEFDYSGTQACKALRKLGYEIVLVNSNPATIMTDPETADVTYIEPLNVDRLTQIIEKERPDALLPNLGGQSGLNLCSELAAAGVLDKYDVKVIGVEIVGEAVEAARENAARNGLGNCEFLAGDVLKVVDELEEKPDLIVLDPPRDGIHPKAIGKILNFGVSHMVYVSCKPTSLARDLEPIQAAGYQVDKVCCVDMFPHTANCETVVSLTRKK